MFSQVKEVNETGDELSIKREVIFFNIPYFIKNFFI